MSIYTHNLIIFNLAYCITWAHLWSETQQNMWASVKYYVSDNHIFMSMSSLHHNLTPRLIGEKEVLLHKSHSITITTDLDLPSDVNMRTMLHDLTLARRALIASSSSSSSAPSSYIFETQDPMKNQFFDMVKKNSCLSDFRDENDIPILQIV